MAIGFDVATVSASVGGTSPKTWTHICSGGILFVAIGYNKSVAAATLTSSATYNGVAMTKLRQQIDTSSFTSFDLFYLVSPAQGSNTVSVTFSPSSGSITAAKAISASYLTTKSTGQFDSSASADNTSGDTITLSTTVVAANCWLVGVLMDSSTSQTVGANTTNRGNTGELQFYDSNGVVATGSQSLVSTSNGGGTSGSWIIVSLLPSPFASVSDTEVTSDSIAVSVQPSNSDSSSTSDSVKARIGFNNTSKNNSTWFNAQKT